MCLDNGFQPTIFQFIVVGKDKILIMHKTRIVLRLVRVTSITMDQEDNIIVVDSEREKEKIYISL